MKAQPQTSLFSELIVDNFAGGGGASTGIELATGRPVDIAINHDPDAILMHKTNHPYTRHYQASVWDIDPVEVCRGQRVGLAWFSPDCKHFSKAKGGKPVDKNIRGLAWIVLRWAAKVRPRVIILENVEEFQTWGPVRRGRPVKSKAGQTFHQWERQLRELGYQIEHRELRACDYGAPTIRNRFFLIARCDGRPIVWPEPTHGDPQSAEVKAGKLKPWHTAAEIIDWSLPCPSIFDTAAEIKAKYGIRAQRPLAENTLRRIARGIQKFVLENPEPFIIECNHTSSKTAYDCFRGLGVDEPMHTVTAHHGYGFVTPVLEVNTMNNTGSAPDAPLKTTITGGHHMLVTPYITKFHGGSTGQDVESPLCTVTAGRESKRAAGAPHAIGIVAPTLIQYHSEQSDREHRGQEANRPLCTVDAAPRYGLVTAFMSKYYAGGYTGHGNAPTDPLNTVTSADHNAVVTSHLVQLNHHSIGQDEHELLHTVTAGASHFGEVRAFLIKYYGQGIGQKVTEPLDTVVSKDRFGLVAIHGIDYMIVDIGLRMLTPRELYAAQGFPADYIIDRDYQGNAYSASKQVARCGNAVPPPFAQALVEANLPELCIRRCRDMAELNATVAV